MKKLLFIAALLASWLPFASTSAENVAKIGSTEYATLTEAVAAAKDLGGSQTINLIGNVSNETVTVQEVADFQLTIDGQKDASSNYTVDATITVDGLRGNGGSNTNGASVTLQNIAFVKTTATDGIVASHYPHHLTIQDCTYFGADNEKWFLNASTDGPLYGVTVKNVTVEHARLIQGNLALDAVFENIVATNDCKVGFNVKTSGTVLIKNCRVTTAKYAFRDYSDGYEGTFTLEDNTFISTSTANDEGAIVNRGGAANAKINVISGTYEGKLTVLNNKEALNIEGGTFTADPTAYLAEGANVVNNNGTYTVIDANTVALIGTTSYETLAEAVAAANASDVIEVVKAGTYTLPNLLKNVTIEGKVDGVVFNHTTAGSVASIPNGATFKNVTFNFGNVNYHGFQHAGTINMEGCTLNGKFFSYGDMNFTNCQFAQSNSDYHMWCYSGNLTYTNCTFTNDATGKFLNVYNESGATKYTITVNDSKFVNNASAANKAALNVKATSGSNVLAYDVIINNCTTEGAFPAASSSDALIVFNELVQVDDRTANGEDNITVTLDNTKIYPINYVAQIGNTKYETLQAALDAAEAADPANIVIDLLADATIDITARANVLSIGTGNTQSITINGNSHTLTFNQKNSDWNDVSTANDAVTKLILNDMSITNSGYNSGHWKRTNIFFSCIVEMNNVTSTALGFKNDATLNNVTIVDDRKDIYGIWIMTNSNNVTINGLTLNTAGNGGRGIAIKDEDSQKIDGTSLVISNATFATEKKGAILVTSPYTVDITASNLDISNVAADNENAVWVDKKHADKYSYVTLTSSDETMIPEGGESAYVASLVRGEQTRGYYATFAAAYASADYAEGDTYKLHKNTTEAVEVAKVLTIVKNGCTAANITAAEGFKKNETEEQITFVTFNPVCEIAGGAKYETLEAAFAAAQDGETVTLLADCTGNGIKAPQGKFTTGLTVDFGGFTYTVDGATVGSTGTETNGFQLLKDNKITFKNGTITSEKAKILVQNYSDLTLEGMTLTLNNSSYSSAYTLSNNNGNIVIDGTTINANPAGGFAFDVCRYASYPSVNVEVKGKSVINGNIEVSASGNDAKDGFGLMLTAGTMTGNIVLDASAKAAMAATPEKALVMKSETFTKDAPADYKWVAAEDGKQKLVPCEYVAQIDTKKYETLEAAFAAAQDGETITLLADCTGNGIKAPQGKFTTGLTVDFAGHTYTVDGATVGSSGTETNGFQLLKENKITFKNGTITSEKAKILVQNYSDLTLEGMTLTLNNANYTSAYTLSNNNGNIVIDGTTINANEAGGFAFDVCRYASYTSVNVEVTGNSTINGDVEIYASNSDAKDGFGLTLTSGTINGDIVLDASAATAMAATPEKAVIKKSNTLTNVAAPADYKWVDNGDGTSTLAPCTYVAQIGEQKYETLAAAIEAAQSGATIQLLKDVTENISVSGGKNFILDLNENTLTGYIDQYDSEIKVQNGTLAGTVYVNGGPATAEAGYNKFTLAADATITSDWGFILYQGPNGNDAYGSLIDINGTVNGTAWVMGNITQGNSVINVNSEAKIEGTVFGLNGLATLNVKEGATIIGSETGIEVRAGKLNVEGGTITSTASEYTYNPNGSGTTTTGAAIAVAQHDTKLATEANILGGTLNGRKAFIVIDAQSNSLEGVTIKLKDELTANAEIPEGYKWVSNGDGTSSLAPKAYVAQIGDTKYETLAGAVYAAEEDATITLLATTVEAVEVAKTLTIVKNGFTAANVTAAGSYMKTETDENITIAKLSDLDIVLVDGQPYTFTKTTQVKSASYKRTLSETYSGKKTYMPWYVPFDYTITDDDVENFTFYKINLIANAASSGTIENTDKIWIILEEMHAGDKLYANRPYIFKYESAGTYTFTTQNATLCAPNSTSRLENSTTGYIFNFYGTYDLTSIQGTQYYYLGTENLSRPVNKAAKLGSYRWYIESTVKDDSGYAPIFLGFKEADSNTTGIQIEDGVRTIDSYYNLNGMKIEKPGKGAYIIKFSDGSTKKVVK